MGDPELNPDGSLKEPVPPADVPHLVRRILESGDVNLDVPHLHERLRSRNLQMGDVLNVLRAGRMDPAYPPEREHGGYRYRICTQRIAVVVAFDSPDELVVITAWRITR